MIKSNLLQRSISGLILSSIIIYSLFSSSFLFLLIIAVISVIMSFEWLELTKNHKIWKNIGVLYISIPIASVIMLKIINPSFVLWLFLVTWSNDIFAYIGGKIIGGKKLCPSISPGKTWSGFFIGTLCCIVIGSLFSIVIFNNANQSLFFFFNITIILSLFCSIGDLLESKIKRIFSVKDSGNIIPGHGGALDRLDSLILSAPIFLIIVFFYNL